MVAGKYELEYDFYSSSAGGGFLFPDSTAYMLIEEPKGDSKGVLTVKYCFAGDNSNEMVMVQTGFSKMNMVPFKISKFEGDATLEDIYNEYSFLGEYSCSSGGHMMLGFTSHFEGNAYTATAKKDDDLDLGSDGCLVV